MNEWDEVTGINPPFNKRLPDKPLVCVHMQEGGFCSGCETCVALRIRSYMRRAASGEVSKGEAIARMEKEIRDYRMWHRDAEHSKSEHARVEQERARAGHGRERER